MSSVSDVSDQDDDYRDHLAEQAFDAENGLRLIREAFALTLYHLWEKQMCSLLGLRHANHDTIVKRIAADGRMSVDELGLDRLRCIANTIKHGKGYPLYRTHPTLFAPEARDLPLGESTGWHFYLRLGEADVDLAISAVEASIPGSRWDAAIIEDVWEADTP